MWYENPTKMGSDGFTPVYPSSFPAEEEIPNDDSPNNFQQDEYNTPTNNHIYSRDMPGRGDDTADTEGFDMRFNMYEFVRVKLDGVAFNYNNGVVEGSRCSAKVAWRSRMELVRDPTTAVTIDDVTTYKWKRNLPAKNGIVLGHNATLASVTLL